MAISITVCGKALVASPRARGAGADPEDTIPSRAQQGVRGAIMSSGYCGVSKGAGVGPAGRPAQSDLRRFGLPITTPLIKVLRRPLESAQDAPAGRLVTVKAPWPRRGSILSSAASDSWAGAARGRRFSELSLRALECPGVSCVSLEVAARARIQHAYSLSGTNPASWSRSRRRGPTTPWRVSRECDVPSAFSIPLLRQHSLGVAALHTPTTKGRCRYVSTGAPESPSITAYGRTAPRQFASYKSRRSTFGLRILSSFIQP